MSMTMFLFVCISTASWGAIIYVDVNVSSTTNNGLTWTTAYSDLQTAINASNSGDEIRVAFGTYYPNAFPNGSSADPRDRAFYLNKNITLSGGWNTTSDNQAGASSVLSGDLVTSGIASDSAYHVLITANLSSSASIRNFTIVAGKANGSGSISFGSQTFARNYGAALSNESSSPKIENVVFHKNVARTYGGGVHNGNASKPEFRNVLFSANTASVGGAMTNFSNSVITLINCSFVFNVSTSTFVGATHNDNSESIIYNSAFYGNVNANGKSTATGTLNSNSTNNAVDFRPTDWPNTKVDLSAKSTTDIFKNPVDPVGTDGIWGTSDDGYTLAAESDLAEAGSASYAPKYDIRGAYRFAPPSIGVFEEALGEGFVPLKLTGFNNDVIAESGTDPAKVTSTSMDNPLSSGRNVMYSKFFKYGASGGQFGLPDNGVIESISNKGVIYQLQPYDSNNVLILTGSESDTLVLLEPGVFQKMAILSASAEGSSSFAVTAFYSDNSTEVVTFAVPDWYGGDNAAIKGFGRVRVNGGFDDDPQNPRLYDNILQLNPAKVVTKLLFKKTNSSSRSCIFAVCGLTPSGVPDWPVATAATNLVNGTGFTANWNSVDKATGYIIDVSTDGEFTQENLVKGYINKDVGNVTTLNVSTSAPTLYYRIRAYNSAGQSVNSNVIRVKLGIDASDFVAISLSGFNADLVAEGTNKDVSQVTTNTFDFPNGTFSDYVLFTKEFRYGAAEGRFGIPNDGKILSASNPGVNYQLMDYTKDNVLLLVGSDSGELTLDLADVYDKLIILSASAEGASSFNVTVTYSDGTTQAKTFTVADWYGGSNPAIQGFGRVQRTTDNYDTVSVDNPRLYDSELDVNATKVVTKLKFKKVNSSSRTGIFAVCGLTPAGVPSKPTALDGASDAGCSGFTLRWNKDPEVTGFVIDVATDSLFTKTVGDYTNKDMGLDTSEYVATTDNIFFRVRSYNSFGQSVSSKIIKAQRDRTTSTTTVANCDSFSWNGSTYNQSGTYEYLTLNSVGCDSVAQLQLTISTSSASSISVSGCGSVEVNGQNYNATGIFTQTIPNDAGCDSVITVNTNIVPAEIDAEFVIATQLISNTDVSIVNISKETPDSSRWVLPSVPGITVLKDTSSELLIQFADSGSYDIGLKTFKDNCSNFSSKSIYVLKGSDLPKVEGRSPFIREFVSYPNPSDGQFTTRIILSAESDVRIRILDANTSITVDDRTEKGAKEYEIPYTLSLQVGVYIMILETPQGNLIQRIVIN